MLLVSNNYESSGITQIIPQRKKTVYLTLFSNIFVVEQKKQFPQLKQPAVGKTKRRYKRKNASPAKNGPSPLKKLLQTGNSPAKSSPSKILPLPINNQGLKVSLF